MTRRSTASSSTDALTADTEREAAERATRRQFFRLFGRQTVSGASSVLAGVAALRVTGREALDELMGSDTRTALPAGQRSRSTAAEPDQPAQPTPDALRSPYRLADDRLIVLDQRDLPGRVTQLELTAPSEVAAAIRVGGLGGGPVLAQVAAYTLLLAALAAEDRPTYARSAALHAAADTLRAARPINRGIGWAVERVLSAAESSDEPPAAIRATADTIAMQAALDHARLGQLAAELLARGEQRDMALLLIGDLGPLAGGMVGPGFAIVQSLAALGCPVHAWLTDGAPLQEGRRASWQMEQLDVPNTTVPDAAVGWLLRQRPMDAVLLRVEWVAANGDAIAPLGSVAAARVARERGVAVYAVAPTLLLDVATADVSMLPEELRMPSSEAAGNRLDPAAEVLPHDLLDGFFTEKGLLRPPFADSIGRAA